MFGLGVKVHCDTSELLQGESRMAAFADKFEHKFLKKWSKAFGVGAMVGGIIGLIHGIFGKPKEIEELSKKFGLTTDEVQLVTVAAKEMGLTFEEYLEKAKKGTVDLAAELRKLREKGIQIISMEDIDTLTKDIGYLSALWEKIKNASIHGTAATLRLPGQMANAAESKSWSMQGSVNRFWQRLGFGPTLFNDSTGERSGNVVSPGIGTSGIGPLGTTLQFSPFVIQQMRQASIKSQIAQLRGQEKALIDQQRDQNSSAIIGGELTGRQQVGTYTSQRGEVGSKLDQMRDALEEIRDSIRRLEEEATK